MGVIMFRKEGAPTKKNIRRAKTSIGSRTKEPGINEREMRMLMTRAKSGDLESIEILKNAPYYITIIETRNPR